MLHITKHAMERLKERYNIANDEINHDELYELCEDNYKYGVVRQNNTYRVVFFYRGKLVKAVYNPKLKVLVTVRPIEEVGKKYG